MLSPPLNGQTGFTLLPPSQTGILFTNILPESRYLTNQILPNGSGVAAGDVDGDGMCDLFFCGLNSDCQLYRNLGNWQFANITQSSGVACPGLDATGAAFADIHGDQHLDLIVNSIGGGTLVFENDGRGCFTLVQKLNPGRGGTSLTLGDVDGDGDLDLYVANYRAQSIVDAPGTRFGIKMINRQPVVTLINGRPLTDPEWTNRFRFKFSLGANGKGSFAHEELGEPDLFCLNDGKGYFAPPTQPAFFDEAGQPLSKPHLDWGLTALFRDFNQDGFPDLYVCNDFGTLDRLWFGDGRGRFRAAPHAALRHVSLASMSLDVADINRDGYDDFLVLDMLSRDHHRRLVQRNISRAELAQASDIFSIPQYPRNTFFANRGDGTYAEIAQYAGIEASDWSWAPLFLDVDLDGYEDLLICSGFVRDNMNRDSMNEIQKAKAGHKLSPFEELQLRRFYPSFPSPKTAFRNSGNFRFEDFSKAWRFDTIGVSQGSCLADLDNDGDLDVIVNNLNTVASIYKNDTTAARIAVRLKGISPNVHGIGSRITILGGPVTQSQEITAAGRYTSCDDTLRSFACGSVTNRLQIEVRWRSGRFSVISNALPNRLYIVAESPGDPIRPVMKPSMSAPLFRDVSHEIQHIHAEEPFDDFARQPLLSRKLSVLGPGVGWWDMDGDGLEDLIIAAGKGGSPACCLNRGNGKFELIKSGMWQKPSDRPQTAVLGWEPGIVLLGVANYEDTQGAGIVACNIKTEIPQDIIPAVKSSFGPLAAADYDRDGNLDLFAGGRVISSQYPSNPESLLFKNQGGKLVLDEKNSAVLKNVGMASSAVWSDLNGDSWPDLLLASEWGPLQIFTNHAGLLSPWNPSVKISVSGTLPEPAKTIQFDSLSKLTGWWNGVAIGDFDEDGRLDFVASNWGQNTAFEWRRQHPLRLYYGDFNEDGAVELFESYYEPTLKKYAPTRMLDEITKVMPFLSERYATHAAWAATGVEDALQGLRFQIKEAAWLETTLFLNRTAYFEAHALHPQAQWAPAFAPSVADFDGDGHLDLFLSQNFFAVEFDASRYDAGRGLLLRGNGRGALSPVDGSESGLKIYGEQRGAAACDFDQDGRVDLAVAQNKSTTCLFRNRGAQPGLRVRLSGPPGNPAAIGAWLRLLSAQEKGPMMELHAGSGYWSQAGLVQIMPQPRSPSQLWIRWPGGRVTTPTVEPGTHEITVGFDGKIQYKQ